jgi:TfoX/Sxy family transcriptional regulator of competence genes
MPYDEGLAERIRACLATRDDVIEKKMFGGVTFMVAGRMACGIVKNELYVRVGAERYDEALARPHARPMDFVARRMNGMVYVARPGVRTQAQLAAWVALGVAQAESAKPRRKPRKR